MTNGQPNESNYRWYILSLAALTNTLTVAVQNMCMPVLFHEIAEQLSLSLEQLGLIWGIGALPGIVTILLGGAIGDRFGTKRFLTLACLLVGLAGALRGLSNNFITLTATVFLFGLLSSAIPINVSKTCSLWFPRRQLGLANGVISMGMALGFMLGSMISATLLSPWLGSWRRVLLFYGVIAMTLSIPWYLTRPAPGVIDPTVGATSHPSMRQALRHVARIRKLWWLGLAILGIGGCIQGMLGYLPTYLKELGWPGARADGAAATFHLMSMLFVIPIALWSDQLGSRKNVLLTATLMVTMGTGLLPIADGLLVWVAVGLAGMVRDGFMAVFLTMIIETEGAGITYAGTAMGLVMVFAGIGNLLAPPLGNSLAAIAPGLPFTFWAILAMVGFFSLYTIQEGGAKKASTAPPSEPMG